MNATTTATLPERYIAQVPSGWAIHTRESGNTYESGVTWPMRDQARAALAEVWANDRRTAIAKASAQ